MRVSAARWAAFQVLQRVELHGGFAVDQLHSDLTKGLDARDLRLAEELTLGVLRWQGELDRQITETSGRAIESLDPEVRLALRLGAYQLQRLDRVPARAAVSESVEIVRQARKGSAAGFVNAVLRKIVANPRADGPAPHDCVPGWLLDRWRSHFGEDRAAALALATLRPPPTYLRLNARFAMDESLAVLAAEGIETEPTDVPYCRWLKSGRPADSRAYRQGRIRIQDIGSQRVAPLLELQPGQRFLDLCASPGGKTLQALEQADRPGPAVACDLYHHRLLTLRRLATLPVALVALDASRPLPFRTKFDRILLDAPCSGTGTLARNPEIKWRLKLEDIGDLAALQRAMLGQALEALEPAGRLVYSTCSLEPEENEGVVDATLRAGFEKRGDYLWLPSKHEGDGFFACVLERT